MSWKSLAIVVLGLVVGNLLMSSTVMFGQQAETSPGRGLDISPTRTLVSNVSPVSLDPETPGAMALGFDGTNYLLVTCNNSSVPSEIIGVLLSGQGVEIKTFSISEHDCQSPHPSLSFDGTNFLLVFDRAGQIFGVRISKSGNLVGEPAEITISSGVPSSDTNAAPDVAFDGTNFLVAWHKSKGGQDIYGARVTPEGVVMQEFPIAQMMGEQVSPSIAFDGDNYLVVWRDTRTGAGPTADTNIFGARVDQSETVLDLGGIAISTAPKIQDSPHIIFDGENYFVVWMDERLTQTSSPFLPILDVFGTRISPEGKLLDGSAGSGGIAINAAGGPSSREKGFPRASFNGTHYLVTWSYPSYPASAPYSGVYAARVSLSGQLIEGPVDSLGIQISTPSGFTDKLLYPNLVSNGRTQLLTWVVNAELGGTSKDIAGVFIERHPIPSTDLNADLIGDLAWRDTTNGATAVWLMNPSGLRQEPTFPGGAGLEWVIKGRGDVDGERSSDLVWRDTDSGATAVWLMNTEGTLREASFPGGAGLDWTIKGVGDVNGDDFADIVWRNEDNGATAMWLMSKAGLREGVTFPGGVGVEWTIKGIGDVTGDGIVDIVWRDEISGATAVWLMNASGLRQSATFPGGADLKWTIQGVADVNGDGLADLVWRNGESGATAVWVMNASGQQQEVTLPGGAGLEWAIRGLVDTNGDSTADIVWRNTNNGATAVWLMDTEASLQGTTYPGGAGLEWQLRP